MIVSSLINQRRGCILSAALMLAGVHSASAQQLVSQGTPASGMDHSMHQHRSVEMPAELPVPSLTLTLFPDAMSGYNLHIAVQRFTLGPPQFSNDTSPHWLSGHGHLYVNGEKKQRVYGIDLHLPGTWFKPGLNQISVTLNDHDHNVWTYQGNEMVATLFINTQREQVVVHHFTSIPSGSARKSTIHAATPAN